MHENDTSDPNFPADLDITPSAPPNQATQDTLTALCAFNMSAQAISIAKYGIAGRVWCVPICALAHVFG
jgi:hypothetical protein